MDFRSHDDICTLKMKMCVYKREKERVSEREREWGERDEGERERERGHVGKKQRFVNVFSIFAL